METDIHPKCITAHSAHLHLGDGVRPWPKHLEELVLDACAGVDCELRSSDCFLDQITYGALLISYSWTWIVDTTQIFTEEQSRWQFDGKYPPVPVNFRSNAKVWSNQLENVEQKLPQIRNTRVYRQLKPKSLCFLRNADDRVNPGGTDIRDVDDWVATDGKDRDLSYVAVAYSSTQFDHRDQEALLDLHRIAERAARDAGVVAYWVAASNMKDTNELQSDVSI